MRIPAFPLTLLLSSALSGCIHEGPDGSGGPDDPGDPGDPQLATTIRLDFKAAPALVAFRDGLDGAWQAATKSSELAFQAKVHGVYTLAVVCVSPVDGSVLLVQSMLMPDEEHLLGELCVTAAPRPAHSLTGHVVQPTTLYAGAASRRSLAPDWDFSIPAPTGLTHLIAISESHIARRVVAVDGDLALATPIDLVQEGQPLTSVSFTASNATPAEAVTASITLDKRDGLVTVYRGASASAKVAPDAMLAPGDKQNVSIRATQGGHFRAQRRPLLVGETAFTLPPPIEDVRIAREGDQLVGSWTQLPPLGYFQLYVQTMTGSIAHYLEATPRALDEAGLSEVTIDTALSGFKSAWRIDLDGEHSRGLLTQLVTGNVVDTSKFDELIAAPTLTAAAPDTASPAPSSLPTVRSRFLP